ncbi:unnamed protein product [Musa banksii]
MWRRPSLRLAVNIVGWGDLSTLERNQIHGRSAKVERAIFSVEKSGDARRHGHSWIQRRFGSFTEDFLAINQRNDGNIKQLVKSMDDHKAMRIRILSLNLEM